MKLSHLLVGIIFFIGMIMGGGLLIGYSQSANPAFVDAEHYAAFEKVFNQQAAMNATIENMKTVMQHKEPSLLTYAEVIYQGAVSIVQTLFFGVQFLFTEIADIPSVIGFGTELTPFIWVIIAALTVTIVLAILSATLYREL